jgi:hypothetical protein
VNEEPVIQIDLTMMGEIYPVGIGKDVKFGPDPQTKQLLQQAAEEAQHYMQNGFANAGFPWWRS